MAGLAWEWCFGGGTARRVGTSQFEVPNTGLLRRIHVTIYAWFMKRQRIKFPWDLYWENKTYKLKRFIGTCRKVPLVSSRHYYKYRKYFMESACVRYLHTSCWRIRNRTSERSERVRFLIQKQRVRKYRTKHFPCGIVFIIYILRHSSFWQPFYFKSFKNA